MPLTLTSTIIDAADIETVTRTPHRHALGRPSGEAIAEITGILAPPRRTH
jgi:hypothetical protein